MQANASASKKDPPKCKKCGFELQESKMLSMSTRKHEFGRMTRDEASQGGWFNSRAEDGDSDNEPNVDRLQGMSFQTQLSDHDDDDDDSDDDDHKSGEDDR